MRNNLDDIYRKMQWNPSPFLIYTHITSYLVLEKG